MTAALFNKAFGYRALGVILLFVLQSALITAVPHHAHFVPNFLLLGAVIYALAHPLRAAVWYSFALGLLLELFSGRPFGAYILALLLSAVLVYFWTRKFTPQELSILRMLFLVVAATVLAALSMYLYSVLFASLGPGPFPAAAEFFSARIFATTAANLIAFYPLYLFIRARSI